MLRRPAASLPQGLDAAVFAPQKTNKSSNFKPTGRSNGYTQIRVSSNQSIPGAARERTVFLKTFFDAARLSF